MWRRHADARHLGIAIDGDLRKHCAPGVRTERGAVLTWFRRPLRLNWLITIALNKCCECVRLRWLRLVEKSVVFRSENQSFQPVQRRLRIIDSKHRKFKDHLLR